MTYTSVFGPILGREQVEQQVLSVLQTPPAGSTYPLIVYYLAEVERQRGLAAQTLPVPPTPDGYRGGLDFNTIMTEWCPMVTVVAQPIDDAERRGSGRYSQWFQIQVAATVAEQDEDTARLLADRYGAALLGAILQQGALGTRLDWETGTTVPFAEKTVLISAPRTEFPGQDPALRRMARSVLTVRSLVETAVNEYAGINGYMTWPASPYTTPPTPATISTVEIALQSESPAGTFAPASGVTVRLPGTGGTSVINE